MEFNIACISNSNCDCQCELICGVCFNHRPKKTLRKFYEHNKVENRQKQLALSLTDRFLKREGKAKKKKILNDYYNSKLWQKTPVEEHRLQLWKVILEK
jgi:hypothetical protein